MEPKNLTVLNKSSVTLSDAFEITRHWWDEVNAYAWLSVHYFLHHLPGPKHFV